MKKLCWYPRQTPNRGARAPKVTRSVAFRTLVSPRVNNLKFCSPTKFPADHDVYYFSFDDNLLSQNCNHNISLTFLQHHYKAKRRGSAYS